MSAGKDTKIFGGLGSISLHDLIQLLGMNGRTATLVLGRQGRKGKIYFKNGNVVHAFTGEIEGQDAFAELLKWEDADFIIEDGIPTLPKVTITESAVGLMLSTLTRLDEDSRETPAVGTPIPPSVAGPPPKTPTSGRVGPRVRRPVSGAVITVPDKPPSSFPVLPVAAVAVLLAGAGITWWVLGRSSEAPVAAAGAAPPPPSTVPPTTAPPSEPAAPEAGAGEADAAPEPADPAPTPTPTPEPRGVLSVDAAPGLELRVDGRPLRPGGQTLAPGRHTIEVTRPEVLGVQRETVEIAAGETLRRTYAADEFGWLQVVVIPWAEVFVDGQSIGQTPMGKVKAAVGEHSLALRHPEVEEKRQTVVIEKGETTLVRVTLQGVSG